ncbi:MAG: YCF48-related protein [Clostridia bacterium]|nr:YCF48-related protein [Clostridia bacterium]
MRLGRKVILGVIVLCVSSMLLQGCSKTQNVKSAEIETVKAEETTAEKGVEKHPKEGEIPESKAWKIALDNEINHASNFIGFLNDSFGITVGYAGEMHYTDNGGKTWPRAKNESKCQYGVDVINGNLAWSSGNFGNVRVTVDGGKTWKAVSDSPSICNYVSFVDEQNGWLSSNKQLESTVNGGKTWKVNKLPEGIKEIAGISLRTEKDGYILNSEGTLFITGDSGETWTRQVLDFKSAGILGGKLSPGSTACAATRFSDKDHGIVVVNGMSQELKLKPWIFETQDGGMTWKTEKLSIAEKYEFGNAFISHDGKYITLSNSKRVVVFKRSGA